MFKDFGRRLQRDIKRTVDTRLKMSEELSLGRIKVNYLRIVLKQFLVRAHHFFNSSRNLSTFK